MEIKNIKEQLVYYKEYETTLKDIWNYVGDTPSKIIAEIEECQLEICDPQIWLYEGTDGQAETIFKLTIAIPVKKEEINAKPNLKVLQAYNCTYFNTQWIMGKFKKIL